MAAEGIESGKMATTGARKSRFSHLPGSRPGCNSAISKTLEKDQRKARKTTRGALSKPRSCGKAEENLPFPKTLNSRQITYIEDPII